MWPREPSKSCQCVGVARRQDKSYKFVVLTESLHISRVNVPYGFQESRKFLLLCNVNARKFMRHRRLITPNLFRFGSEPAERGDSSNGECHAREGGEDDDNGVGH